MSAQPAVRALSKTPSITSDRRCLTSGAITVAWTNMAKRKRCASMRGVEQSSGVRRQLSPMKLQRPDRAPVFVKLRVAQLAIPSEILPAASFKRSARIFDLFFQQQGYAWGAGDLRAGRYVGAAGGCRPGRCRRAGTCGRGRAVVGRPRAGARLSSPGLRRRAGSCRSRYRPAGQPWSRC